MGVGTYATNSPGFSYVEFDRDTGTYSDTEIDDGAFNVVDITECLSFKSGVCQEEIVIGTKLETTGIGNAVVFKMLGTGLKPNFIESVNSLARVCFAKDSDVSDQSSASAIAAEIQDIGDCQTIDLSQQVPFIHGIANEIQHVMIELLPGRVSTTRVCIKEQKGECKEYESQTTIPTMNFEGVEIVSTDWQSLSTLTPGDRYESVFANRANSDQFAYIGEWSTQPDTEWYTFRNIL